MIWQISENPVQNCGSLLFSKYTNYIAQGVSDFRDIFCRFRRFKETFERMKAERHLDNTYYIIRLHKTFC